MVSSSIIQSRIANFFSDKLHIGVPSCDTDLVQSGILDSLALVDLILFIEREFRIEVPLDEIDHFRSIQSIANLIANTVAVAT